MSTEEALTRLREIVRGIDNDACEVEDGWWETSVGAAFGAGVLADLEDLVRVLTT